MEFDNKNKNADDTKAVVPAVAPVAAPQKEKEKEEDIRIKEYSDIKKRWDEGGDKLLLSELIILRMSQEFGLAKMKKNFAIIKSIGNNGKKLTGVYVIKDISEDNAEDVVIAENYDSGTVLIVARESVVTGMF
jgi:hypothetical protein